MFTLKSFAQYFRTYPLRGVLTVLTIAIGVGALIITFSLSFDVGHALERSISIEGRRIVIANGTLNADGNLAPQRPPRFSGAAPGTFELEYENLRDATRVAPARWTRATSGGTSYQVRSEITTTGRRASCSVGPRRRLAARSALPCPRCRPAAAPVGSAAGSA